MNAVDRLLQRWRIAHAVKLIPEGASVLDVGTADGSLFVALGSRLGRGLGIDPDLPDIVHGSRFELRPGRFPESLPPGERFDVITMLAVLEHVPEPDLEGWVEACLERLHPGGRVILTVPSPLVDPILDVLMRLRVLDGMETDQHHGFDVGEVPGLFIGGGAFTMARRSRFQLGLNHLFAFDVAPAGDREVVQAR